MNLTLRLEEISSAYPEHEAIIYNESRYSYGQLNAQIKNFADGLKKLAVQQGDRILIDLANCPEFIVSYFAVIRIKGILVPINPQYSIAEIERIISDAKPVAAITDVYTAPAFVKLKKKMDLSLNIIVVTGSETTDQELYSFTQILNSGNASHAPIHSYEPDEVIELLYTRGITATLKGAMLTNQNLYSNATTFADIARLTPGERVLLASPAYHAAAQTCAMSATLIAGATLVIQDNRINAENILDIIQKERITFFFGTHAMYRMMIEFPEAERFDTGSLRVAYTAAAPLPTELFQAFKEKFGLQITEGYGLTQTSSLICSNPFDGNQKPGSAGRPIPGVKIKLVDNDDQEVPEGQVGEIVVKGVNVMKGYYGQEEETRWEMRNGWFHTGDLAYMDNDGYLFIVDHKKDLIVRSGLNVDPREVEDVLYTHPNVFEAAVIGVPDPVRGEEVLALVSLRKGSRMEAKELQEFCKDKLASYKIPRYIHFVEGLPKTSSGKVLINELKHIIENY